MRTKFSNTVHVKLLLLAFEKINSNLAGIEHNLSKKIITFIYPLTDLLIIKHRYIIIVFFKLPVVSLQQFSLDYLHTIIIITIIFIIILII